MLPPTDLESDRNLYDHVDVAIIRSRDSTQRENEVAAKIQLIIVVVPGVVVPGGIASESPIRWGKG
jgi:hypothetical protein